MKVSLNWIRDYVDFTDNIGEYTEKMTMSGTKVEGYETLGENIQNIVAGKVLSTEPHPDSDHLTVCKVDTGGESPLQIVTGAVNVKAGDMVPVCINGARLPDGKVIKTGKLRGVLSEGMLCSINELELSLHDFPYADENGIFIMKESCRPGDDIRDVLMLRDVLVDFELTFNRPDCLAFLGIARETAATFGVKLKYREPDISPKNNGETVSDYIAVKVENPALCPRYTARVINNVKIQASPLWMRARLRACGVRPINNIVDITNYVMLEYGQPMHAFDYSFITSKTIVVRNASGGEKITTLDGTVRELDDTMLCIADGEKAIALAGIMGGENSEISDSTAAVVFESANFNRENIRFTSRTVGLRTDSSKRFEKGLPPYNALLAVNRACELVELLGCGEVVNGAIDVCQANIQPTRVKFDPERVNQLLGTNLSKEEMADILKKIEITADGNELIVPPYRNDIINTADVAEEVVRLYGLDNIQGTCFEGRAREGRLTESYGFVGKTGSACVALGFNEIYTYSFISPSFLDKIRLSLNDEKRDVIRLLNPIGDETSVMRTTALPSLLSCMETNYSRRILSAKLFETATVYKKAPDGMSDERKILCMGFYGGGDFYDMKGYIEAVFAFLGITNHAFVRDETGGTYHPGRCALITAGGKPIGIFGQIHPLTAKEFGLDCEVYAAEIEINGLYENRTREPQYIPVPVYPAVERDLALVMNEDTEAGEVISLIRKYSGKFLTGVEVFDVYRGKGIEAGKKSIAFRLTYRKSDGTLNDGEVDGAVNKVLRRLQEDKEIVIRS
ncbi:MAG: phenylalanine--tRNA ligase subunit beta [Eubacteriales bacterium]|nr:phenylalanine--tRNA ligase subunit beta [Eubacteriales bacterium]